MLKIFSMVQHGQHDMLNYMLNKNSAWFSMEIQNGSAWFLAFLIDIQHGSACKTMLK
jgi:hypothetical protein